MSSKKCVKIRRSIPRSADRSGVFELSQNAFEILLVESLGLSERGENLPGLPGIMALPIQIGDQVFLAREMASPFGNVTFCYGQMSFEQGTIHVDHA